MTEPPPAVTTARVPASRSFALLGSGQAVARLFAFATTLYLARTLGAEMFGIVTFALAVLAYAALVVDFGFDALGPVEVARGSISPAALVPTVMTMRLALAVVAAAGLAAFVSAAPLSAQAAAIVLAFALSLPIAALDLRWALLGIEAVAPAALAEVTLYALQALGTVAFVRGVRDLWRVPLVFVAAQGVSVAVGWLAWRRRCGWPRLGIDRRLARTMLPAALPLAGSAAVGMLLQNFDLVLIGLWLGLGPAGVYGAAYRVVWLPTILVVAYAIALRPAVVRACASGPAAVESVLTRSHRLMACVGVGATVGGALLARPLLEMLYGPAFAAAARPFQVLLGALLLMLFSRPYRLVLLAARLQSLDFRILLVAAAVNVAGNLLLLPRWGLLGAAGATLASEAVLLALSHAAVRRIAPAVSLLTNLARPAVCAAVMAALLIAVSSWPLPARVAVGAAAYLSLALVLGVLDPRELRGLLRGWRPTAIRQ